MFKETSICAIYYTEIVLNSIHLNLWGSAWLFSGSTVFCGSNLRLRKGKKRRAVSVDNLAGIHKVIDGPVYTGSGFAQGKHGHRRQRLLMAGPDVQSSTPSDSSISSTHALPTGRRATSGAASTQPQEVPLC